MLKRTLVIILAVCFISSGAAAAQSARAGLGLIFMEPWGLTGKAWFSRTTAVAGGIGWSAEENHYLHLHADFLFLRTGLAPDANLKLEFYLGVGGKFIFRDTDKAWLRLPLGFDLFLSKSPLNFFFEVVPSSDFSDLKLFAAAGFRYSFRR